MEYILRFALQWLASWVSNRLYDTSEWINWMLVGNAAIASYRKAISSGQQEDVIEAINMMQKSVDRFAISGSEAQREAERCLRQLKGMGTENDIQT